MTEETETLYKGDFRLHVSSVGLQNRQLLREKSRLLRFDNGGSKTPLGRSEALIRTCGRLRLRASASTVQYTVSYRSLLLVFSSSN